MAAQLQLFESRGNAERWTVRESRRARHLSVRVYPGGRVEVVVPPGAAPTTVQRFVGTHRQWIDRRIKEMSGTSGALDRRRPVSIRLPAIDRHYAVEYEHSVAARRVRAVAGGLWVRGPLHDDAAIVTLLRQWLTNLAYEELGQRVAAIARDSGLRFNQVQIRRQRTRWGSCSVTGTISLNACLLFLDPAVVHYLLVHELCHTKHMNHSQRFWSLVEAHEPEYRRLDRELLRGWQHVPGWMFR